MAPVTRTRRCHYVGPDALHTAQRAGVAIHVESSVDLGYGAQTRNEGCAGDSRRMVSPYLDRFTGFRTVSRNSWRNCAIAVPWNCRLSLVDSRLAGPRGSS